MLSNKQLAKAVLDSLRGRTVAPLNNEDLISEYGDIMQSSPITYYCDLTDTAPTLSLLSTEKDVERVDVVVMPIIDTAKISILLPDRLCGKQRYEVEHRIRRMVESSLFGEIKIIRNGYLVTDSHHYRFINSQSGCYIERAPLSRLNKDMELKWERVKNYYVDAISNPPVLYNSADEFAEALERLGIIQR